MIRLIALDLDDTLLTTDKHVSPGNRAALQACMDRGIRVVTASGRFNESQLVFIRMLDLGLEHALHLGDGGGTIFSEEGIVSRMGTFEPDLYRQVLETARSLELPCFVTNGSNVYYDIPEQPLIEIYSRVKGGRRPYIFKIDDLMTVTDALKFVFAFTNTDEYARITSIRCPGTINISAGRNLREINMASLDKLQGLKVLAGMYGVTMDEVASFGDSENDIPMLRGSALGFAVANAAPAVKEAADVVGTCTNDEDGVARLIEEYILN
jgi:Cof subfamily protein (haloacid dehalogenase superfamily)